MLGDGFISVFTYREDANDKTPTRPRGRSQPCRDPLRDTSTDKTALKLIRGKEELPGLKEGLEEPGPGVSLQPSPALSIPNNEANQYLGLELYRSWCCTSFCKDYPDLQLRGDHVGDRDSESPRLEYDSCEGPLLQSRDLEELVPLQSGSVPPVLQVETELPHDEGYLVMDSSIMLDKREPLSNSMLNGYLESKLLEVYRQYLQDSLVRGGSPTSPSLPPSFVPPMIDQLSHQLSLEQGLDASVARSVVVNYLSSQRTCTASSHFSSPVLRISNVDQRKKAPSHYQPL
ncbi:hypothetical protein MATL_G00170570 [Megalops atlanticus]|uniref:Uncharacterized protein n=1 Tax=Megalops atlanticus TaxID=7932 RepID=A0A9D3PPI6_MEGAT|nr:hypothetical protein MATL_G00170570 [Megalops atlanticus]